MGYPSWRQSLVYIVYAFLFLSMYVAIHYIKIENVINAFTRNLQSELDVDFKKIIKMCNIKYILLWTSSKNVPFVYLGRGQEAFIRESCKHINCYVTDDQDLLGDITMFDVVAFNAPDVSQLTRILLPQNRSPSQKYAFASIESPIYYPMNDVSYDSYFNWTWTFKLDSDTRWGYTAIRNIQGNVIGPNKVMHWMKTEDMEPVSDELMAILKGKSKAAAWFASNCFTKSDREVFVGHLQVELDRYGLKIDIYGKCGFLDCGPYSEESCDNLVEKDYYFYLAFENAFSEDYVTEKVLHGLQYSAIPIVYGSANYTRFLPDGIYLNALKLGVNTLAAKMNYLIHDIDEYSKYFKWRKHYYYNSRSDSEDTNDYCGICALLNNETKMKETSVYEHFTQWWNY